MAIGYAENKLIPPKILAVGYLLNEISSEGRVVCLADFFLVALLSTCTRGISWQIMTVVLMLGRGQTIYSVSDRRSRRPSSAKPFSLPFKDLLLFSCCAQTRIL